MAGGQIAPSDLAVRLLRRSCRVAKGAHWHVLQRARAIENGAFVIAAAQGGLHEDGRETYGHSLIVDPWGRVLAEADHDEPAVVIADLDMAASAAARAKVPNLKNAREFRVEASGGAAQQRQAS